MSSLFRRQAVEHHAGGQQGGDVLRFDPTWVRVAYRLVGASLVAAGLFSVFFNVDEYATGPAVVRLDGRRMITATVAAPVESLAVNPGQWVEPGDVLVRFVATEEVTELARATAEFDLSLVRLLADPTDGVAKQTLASLRARRESARNAVDMKTVRATAAGMVSDVRVRPGQPVTPGEVLCAIVPKNAQQVSLVAMVPAEYRPMLKSGLKMRFELDGFRYEYADLDVEEVSVEAVGPAEVQRFLGHERADAVRLDAGGKVFVTAKLPASTFVSEGHPYGYYDGLTGTAEVRVRSEPIIVTLIPALRRVSSR
jgi:membrane fusion protein (multidrug efflux system)